jgi:hypothetical protein
MVRGTEPLREDETWGAAERNIVSEIRSCGWEDDAPTCWGSSTGSSIAASHELVQVPILIPSIICVDISLGSRVSVDADPQLEVIAEMLLAGYMGE